MALEQEIKSRGAAINLTYLPRLLTPLTFIFFLDPAISESWVFLTSSRYDSLSDSVESRVFPNIICM